MKKVSEMENKNIIYKILNRREKKRREGEIREFGSSSVGDLAFLLLIFFIVTGSFMLRQGIFFLLPSQSAGSIKLEEKQIVEIQPENNGFILNGNPLSRTSLIKALIDIKEKTSSIVLMIQMKSQVKYERLVDTLSVARETGIKRVSLKNIGGGDRNE